jgi:DNA-binding MarR family transcriptional regulator
MTSLDDSSSEGAAALDDLVKSLDKAERAANKVFVRWLLHTEVPLLSACVLFTLDPEDAPLGSREVADELGIPIEDATRALHELRSLGFAHEYKRRYEPTQEGERLHASLVRARREALAAFLSGLDEQGRRDLAAALADEAQP